VPRRKHHEARGLKDEEQLQSYFVQRIERFLRTKGKLTVGWDEFWKEPGSECDCDVVARRGGGIEAADKAQVIMTPSTIAISITTRAIRSASLRVSAALPHSKRSMAMILSRRS